jgi:hypothetical protein
MGVKSYQESNDKVNGIVGMYLSFYPYLIGHGGPATDECRLCVGP